MEKRYVIKNLLVDSYYTGHTDMTNIAFAETSYRYEDAEEKLMNDKYFSNGGVYQIVEVYPESFKN